MAAAPQICGRSLCSLCQSVSAVAGRITVLNLEPPIGFSCGPTYVCTRAEGEWQAPGGPQLTAAGCLRLAGPAALRQSWICLPVAASALSCVL